jgi:hypothetical protein
MNIKSTDRLRHEFDMLTIIYNTYCLIFTYQSKEKLVLLGDLIAF